MKLASPFLHTAADFRPMFAAMLQLLPRLSYSVNSNIAWAKTNLKREDRIVWYLRWCRYQWVAVEAGFKGQKPEDQQKLEQMRVQYKQDLVRKGVAAGNIDSGRFRFNIEEAQSQLQHLFSMDIPAIQNARFTAEPVQDTIYQLQSYERQYQQEQSNKLVPHSEDQIILQFPDGWAWWRLPRASCSEEAKAMGHCGNSPEAGNPDMNILSLREPHHVGKQIKWEPHCTFIYNTKRESIGEMKGKGNAKPVERYHKYICALLKLPMIKGVIGGGYLPSHNFKITDLSDEFRKDLQLVRPDLAGSGSNIGSVQRIIDLLELDNDSYDEEEEKFTVKTYATAIDYFKAIGGSYNDVYALAAGDEEPEKPTVDEIIDILVEQCNAATCSERVQAPDYVTNLGYRIKYEYPDEIPEGFDPENDEEVFQFLEDHEPDERFAVAGHSIWRDLAHIWYTTVPGQWDAQNELENALEYIDSDGNNESPHGVEVAPEGGLNDSVDLKISLEKAEQFANLVDSGHDIPDWDDGLRSYVSEYWDDGFKSNNADYTQEETLKYFGHRPRNPYPVGQESLFDDEKADEEGIKISRLKSRLLQPVSAV